MASAKKPAPAKKAGKKFKPAPPPGDWPAILRSGPAGVRKWNRLTIANRGAVELAGADLGGADLAACNFRAARLDGTGFAGCNLAGAAFEGAVLRKADFRRADLTAARLDRAELHGADFTEAALDGANLDGATFDKNTKWPDGFAVPGEAVFAGGGADPRFSGKGKKAVAADINGLVARLHTHIDPKRMKRTADMLKGGKNQLFAEVEPDLVRGVVKSQNEPDLVYSCVLTSGGVYSCASQEVAACMGLRGEPCKHLLVLVIGLARAGQLDAATADAWLLAAKGKNPKWNKTTQNHVSDTLLRYKGAQAGEVDWRPTETIPEDFYAM